QELVKDKQIVQQIDVSTDYTRRYRNSRFRPFPELWSVYRASRVERPGAADASPARDAPDKQAVGGG
ncbi:MAG: hypothetical protein ACWGON_11470, partial [Gemmatimonadota bacterium]